MKNTIHDVARLAGVSTGTVSRVLNKHKSVKDSTRKLVQETIDKLGFVPESSARQLSRGKSLNIGIHLQKDTLHLAPFYVLFFQHIMKKVMASGDRVIDLPSQPNGLPKPGVDGIILLGAHQGDPRMHYLEKQGLPYVLVGHHMGRAWVAPDDYNGGEQVASYLSECKHRNIIFVCSGHNFQAGQDRLRGFKDELARRGIDFDDEHICTTIDTSLQAYRSFRRFFLERRSLCESCTAVFATSDVIACGVWAALEDLGQRIPEDFSLIGFDDLPEIGASLTTVHQNIPEIAKISLKLICDQIDGKEPLGHIVPVQLVVRGSSGLNIR